MTARMPSAMARKPAAAISADTRTDRVLTGRIVGGYARARPGSFAPTRTVLETGQLSIGWVAVAIEAEE